MNTTQPYTWVPANTLQIDDIFVANHVYDSDMSGSAGAPHRTQPWKLAVVSGWGFEGVKQTELYSDGTLSGLTQTREFSNTEWAYYLGSITTRHLLAIDAEANDSLPDWTKELPRDEDGALHIESAPTFTGPLVTVTVRLPDNPVPVTMSFPANRVLSYTSIQLLQETSPDNV